MILVVMNLVIKSERVCKMRKVIVSEWYGTKSDEMLKTLCLFWLVSWMDLCKSW